MSLYKQKGSKYWYARFKNHRGKWVSKSTGTTNKSIAKQLEREWFNESVKERELGLEKITNISLAKFIDVYEEDRAVSHAEDTVAIDKRALTQLLEVIGPIKSIADITSDDIAKYKRSQKNKGLSPYTINKRLRHLGTAFRWAIKHNYTRINPTTEVSKLQTPQKLPREIPKEDVKTLIEESQGKWVGDYIRAAAYGGFRSGEIVGISEDAIDFTNGFVAVRGKFGKERQVPLFPSLKSLFEEILSRSEKEDLRYLRKSGHDGRAPGMLFYQVHKTTSIYHAFKDIIEEKWPNDEKRNRYRFHDLRHTFATNYLRNGGSLEKLRKILGHEKIQTTLIYEHLIVDDLQEDEDPVTY